MLVLVFIYGVIIVFINKMIQRIHLSAYPTTFHQASNTLQQHDLSQSCLLFNKCIEQNPSSYSSYLNLAYIQQVRKNYKNAIKLLDVAINIKPYSSQAYYNRCLALASIGRFGEAGVDIHAAISCLYFQQFFKGDGDIYLLEKSVQYADNHLQALRLILILSNSQRFRNANLIKNRQQYERLLESHQASFRVQGHIAYKQKCFSSQHGLYRLQPRPNISTLQDIKQQITLYLRYRQKIPVISANDHKKGKAPTNISLTPQIYQVMIEADVLSDRGSKVVKSNSESDEESESVGNSEVQTYTYRISKVQTQIQQKRRRHTTSTNILQEIHHLRLSSPSINVHTVTNQKQQKTAINYRLSVPNTNFDNENKQNSSKKKDAGRYSLHVNDMSNFQNSSTRLRTPLNRSRVCLGGGGLAASRMANSRLAHSRVSNCGASVATSRICRSGCTKCGRQSETLPKIGADAARLQIKTLQIFRNQHIYQPKPYLIIYNNQEQHVTQIDQEGGHFPKWNQTFHISPNNTNNSIFGINDGLNKIECRIQLWHKDNREKEDYLIGVTSLSVDLDKNKNKMGRYKCYFVKGGAGGKKTGYVFLQLNK